MSGHCPQCGTYHEEDDDRVCGSCANFSTDARIASLESALAAMTKERDELREAVRVLSAECCEWRLAHVCSPVSLIDAPIIRARKRTMNNPIARAAVEGKR